MRNIFSTISSVAASFASQVRMNYNARMFHLMNMTVKATSYRGTKLHNEADIMKAVNKAFAEHCEEDEIMDNDYDALERWVPLHGQAAMCALYDNPNQMLMAKIPAFNFKVEASNMTPEEAKMQREALTAAGIYGKIFVDHTNFVNMIVDYCTLNKVQPTDEMVNTMMVWILNHERRHTTQTMELIGSNANMNPFEVMGSACEVDADWHGFKCAVKWWWNNSSSNQSAAA